MRVLGALMVVALVEPLSARAATKAPPKCVPLATPTSAVAPELPLLLHNEFKGSIWVGYTIDRLGAVRNLTIRRRKFTPLGNSSGDPIGYDEAAIKAVAQWKFPVRASECRQASEIRFAWGNDK